MRRAKVYEQDREPEDHAVHEVHAFQLSVFRKGKQFLVKSFCFFTGLFFRLRGLCVIHSHHRFKINKNSGAELIDPLPIRVWQDQSITF